MSTIPSKTKLDSYVDMGLLISKRHDELPLTIYNYSQLTVMDKLWNSVTRACRGLVVDDKGRCVVRCIPKFFNADEPHAHFFKNEAGSETITILNSEGEEEEVVKREGSDELYYTDKMDGSLIQMVNDEEYGFIVTSKGSFNSDQSKWASEIFLRHFDPEHLDFGKSYICELIHPENRIVLDYGDAKELRLITIIETETGLEKWDIWSRTWSSFIEPVDRVVDLEKHMAELNEGVVSVENGHRVKHKTEEYVRLHRIVTDFTPKRVWEALKEGDDLEFHNMPEEFEEWLEKTKAYFISKYNGLWEAAHVDFVGTQEWSDKELGLSKTIDPKIKGLVFMIRNNKPIDGKIWNMIKP